MNPDNPTFRTEAEERRAEEYVKLKAERDRYKSALESIAKWQTNDGFYTQEAKTAMRALSPEVQK